MPYGYCFHTVYCHVQPRAKLCLDHSRDCMYAMGQGVWQKTGRKIPLQAAFRVKAPPHTHTAIQSPTRSWLMEVPRTAYLWAELCSGLLNHPNSGAPSYQQPRVIFAMYILPTFCRSLFQLGFIKTPFHQKRKVLNNDCSFLLVQVDRNQKVSCNEVTQ